MIIRDQFYPHFVSLVFFVYSGSGRDTGHLHFSTPHLLPGRGHGTGDSQGPGLTISFSDEISVFSGNEIRFEISVNFGGFRWILNEIC